MALGFSYHSCQLKVTVKLNPELAFSNIQTHGHMESG
jgi:hypothetical protein